MENNLNENENNNNESNNNNKKIFASIFTFVFLSIFLNVLPGYIDHLKANIEAIKVLLNFDFVIALVCIVALYRCGQVIGITSFHDLLKK